MKRISILIIVFLFQFNINFAQRYSTLEQYETYYLENYSSLNKIEGIWSVFSTVYIAPMEYNISKTEVLDNLDVAIISDGTGYSEYVITNGVYQPQNWSNTFSTLFSSYNCDHKFHLTEQKCECTSFNISDNKFSFSCHVYSTLNNVKYFIKFSYSYVKIFPLASDIIGIKREIKRVKSSGTAFAISSDGYVITNYHVVENSSKIIIKGANGYLSKSYSAKIIISDKNNDLVILKIDDNSFTSLGIIPYTINSTLSNVGENIFVLGYPLTASMGEEIKLTNGIISSKSGFQGDITSYQMTAPIQPGNSGAPMFDKDGYLVGIVNAKHLEAENVGYAIKSNYLFNLIESSPIKINLPTFNSLQGKELPTQVQLVKNFIYIVEVE